jgi:L-alanine-DL-glutamate epimerase-like enolase superfamily enzyme
MSICALDVYKIEVPLFKPFRTALRTVDACHDIIVKVSFEDGSFGLGSAAPTPAITGENHESMVKAIKDFIAPSLLGVDLSHRVVAQDLVKSSLPGNNSAKAAVDMALYDAWCKAHGLPLCAALGGEARTLTTDITICLGSPDAMLADTLEGISKGFESFKIKVGSTIEEDLERIKRIVIGTDNNFEYRIDANQAWSVDDSIKICAKLADLGFNIPFIEQPVKSRDFEGLKKVSKSSPLRILADESCFSYRDALTLLQMDACDLLNVKLMKAGSIDDALRIIDLASEFGKECMISSMLESKLGITCAAAIACARPSINYIDLDAAHMQKIDPFLGGVHLNGPLIEVPEAVGHGISEVSGLFSF